MASPGELMAAAVERTGLDDFGDDSFREGLEILVTALRDEARLNERGEGFVYARIGLHLRQRLQVEDWYRRHPEIDDVRDRARRCSGSGCRAPVRPRCRFCSRRIPTSATSAAGSPPSRVRRRRRSRATIRAFRRSSAPCSVGTRHHVPTDIHGPMECLDLMALDFTSQIFQAFAQIPSYSEWLA